MNGDEESTGSPREDRTVFSPQTSFAPPSPPQPVTELARSAFPTLGAATSAGIAGLGQPVGEPRRIQVGDVLNHIFEVRRFIARGGMGEVFEGVNINSDERVAIKVILPHLAADPAVLELFRKEARTLTRLSHPSLVQYRVLAQEPQIGALYIVTEFIEGQNLSDLLPQIDVTPTDLVMLIKRLAEGLAEAHRLGAIHRDISPDNVMLEAGKLNHAKIIDFGIAKDLAPGSATIVGDGFAGKMNYVAPEQLGDFNRQVGAWTDVYGLGLTILAVARRKDVDMGGSFVDAIDKRRTGPDLSPVPEELRPVLARMLEPDPAKRVRSMEEVVKLLAGGSAPPPRPPSGVQAPPTVVAEPKSTFRKPVMVGGAGLTALMALLLGWHFISGSSGKPTAATPKPTAASIANPVATAREAVTSGLAAVPCSWLDLVNVEANGGNVSLSFSGVAGKPAEAQAAISRLLSEHGLQAGSIDLGDVEPLEEEVCRPLESFSKIRAIGAPHLSAALHEFTMSTLGASAGTDAGKLGANPIVDFNLSGLSGDFSVIALGPNGTIEQLLKPSDLSDPRVFSQIKPNVYRLKSFFVTHPGWSALLMLTGNGPFDPVLLNKSTEPPGPDWPAQFLAVAQQRGWHAEMVWFHTKIEGQN